MRTTNPSRLIFEAEGHIYDEQPAGATKKPEQRKTKAKDEPASKAGAITKKKATPKVAKKGAAAKKETEACSIVYFDQWFDGLFVCLHAQLNVRLHVMKAAMAVKKMIKKTAKADTSKKPLDKADKPAAPKLVRSVPLHAHGQYA